MDNFRRPRREKRRVNMDGFVKKNRNLSTGSLDFNRRPPAHVHHRLGQINNFSRAEGFHPAQQPKLNVAAEQTATNELVIDFDNTAHTKRFKKKRRSKPLRSGRFYQRHGPLKWISTFKEASWRKRALIIFITLVLLAGMIFVIRAYFAQRNILRGGGEGIAWSDDIDPSLLNVEGDGRINILLLGKGGPGHAGPDLTDTIMLASIDPLHDEAGLLSTPRDLYVNIPGDGSTKINSVYALEKTRVLSSGRLTNQLREEAEQAGLDAVKNVAEEVLGVPVHYRVMVDFTAFKKAINTVGGIEVDVQEQLYDPTVAWENNFDPLIADTGIQKFDGNRALLYARSRYGSARGDFDRAERQREVIIAAMNKVLSLGTFSNPIKVNQLLDDFGSHVRTDFNRNDLPKLYDIAKDIPGDNVKSISLTDEKNGFITTGTISLASGQLGCAAGPQCPSIDLPKEGLYKYDKIHHYVRNTLRDSFIKREDAEVMILNGSGQANKGQEMSKLLKSYGYRVGTVGDAPSSDYDKTILVNLKGDEVKYTNHYLQKRIGVASIGNLPSGIEPGTATFVIIIGRQ